MTPPPEIAEALPLCPLCQHQQWKFHPNTSQPGVQVLKCQRCDYKLVLNPPDESRCVCCGGRAETCGCPDVGWCEECGKCPEHCLEAFIGTCSLCPEQEATRGTGGEG